VLDTGRPKAHIITYGCQMNENDSEVLLAYLEELGYEWCDRAEDADLVLLNTCCVREGAEQKALGKLGDLKQLKDRNPNLFIGLGGCMPQQPGRAEEIARQAPHLNLVFGTHNIHRFPILYQSSRTATAPVVEIADEPDELPVFPRGVRQGGVTAWVTILRGCDKRCTYCIVPYVRGREMSRPLAEVVAEVEALVAEGVREVTLLGQNVNAYGHDLPGGQTTFATLLRALDRVEGLYRIRYTTSHPRDFTQEMIETIAESEKVCEHFHLPVQSGSNYILKRMARGYPKEKFLDLVRRVREAIPHASITTDLIVGFPGETEEHFQETLDLVEQVGFDKSYMFMYSPRRGTPAASFPDQVPLAVKKERLARLMELQNRISLAKNEAQVGRTVEVLVEGPSRTNADVLMGRARDNRIVLFRGDPGWKGTLRPVRVTRANTWTLEGEAV
jgi:tRNA-2-methylthio-N6-dimethylallyladenosine synthase